MSVDDNLVDVIRRNQRRTVRLAGIDANAQVQQTLSPLIDGEAEVVFDSSTKPSRRKIIRNAYLKVPDVGCINRYLLINGISSLNPDHILDSLGVYEILLGGSTVHSDSLGRVISLMDRQVNEINYQKDQLHADGGPPEDWFRCSIDEGIFYRVEKVHDGDTFVLDNDCSGVTIRLIGVNAPESRNYFDNIKEEPFGKEASTYLSKLLIGQQVRVEYDVDKVDGFKRTLAYCFLEDGTFINKRIVQDGFAQIATYPPNVKYVDVFKEAQRQARNEQRGMWGTPIIE